MIKCFEPSLSSMEEEAIKQCFADKQLGFGNKVHDFEKKFSLFSKKEFNIGLNSASAAAYILFSYFKHKYGKCNVYTPSLTFASPTWAALKNDHNIIFVDVTDELLFDCDDYAKKRRSGKNIVMPMLYGGVTNIENFKIDPEDLVVLDSAHCVSPKMRHDYAFYSFHPVKPICMSTGGMLSTNDNECAEYALSYRNFGRLKKDSSYDIIQEGFKFYMTNIDASMGIVQLERCEQNIQKRKQNYNFIKKELEGIRFINHDNDSSYYLGTILKENNFKIIEFLRDIGIECSFHYPPLHMTKFFKNGQSLKKTEKLKNEIINFPIHQELTTSQLRKVLKNLKEIIYVK